MRVLSTVTCAATLLLFHTAHAQTTPPPLPPATPEETPPPPLPPPSSPSPATEAPPSSAPAPTPPPPEPTAPAPSKVYLALDVGLGFASLNEDRPKSTHSTNAKEVTSSGVSVLVYAGAGFRPMPALAVGLGASIILTPSPSIEFKLRDVGTPIVNDGSALGGVIGPMIAFRPVPNIDLNAVLGYGGYGRGSPSPGYGGSGFAFSVGGSYLLPVAPQIALSFGLRLLGGIFSYDGGDQGSYSSFLIAPALMTGFAFR